MKAISNVGAVLVFVAMGCSREPLSGPPGNAALGIAEFQVTETSSELLVLGLDAKGDVVGQVSLRHGMFRIPVDGELVSSVPVQGKQLAVQLGERQLEQITGAATPGRMPAPSDDMGTLLLDPHVAEALQRWDFTITPPLQKDPTQGEVPYSLACTFAATTSCDNIPQTDPCCQLGSSQMRCCNTSRQLASRSCHSGTRTCLHGGNYAQCNKPNSTCDATDVTCPSGEHACINSNFPNYCGCCDDVCNAIVGPENGCSTCYTTNFGSGTCLLSGLDGSYCAGFVCTGMVNAQICGQSGSYPGACTDVDSNASNCGSCGHVCAGGATCHGGQCCGATGGACCNDGTCSGGGACCNGVCTTQVFCE